MRRLGDGRLPSNFPVSRNSDNPMGGYGDERRTDTPGSAQRISRSVHFRTPGGGIPPLPESVPVPTAPINRTDVRMRKKYGKQSLPALHEAATGNDPSAQSGKQDRPAISEPYTRS